MIEQVMNENKIYRAAIYCRLIERIEIGYTVKMGRCNQQEVTIYYRFIGAVEEN